MWRFAPARTLIYNVTTNVNRSGIGEDKNMKHNPGLRLLISWCLFSGLLTVAALAQSGHPLDARPGALPSSAELHRWFEFSKDVARGLCEGDPRFGLELKNSGQENSAYAKVLFEGEVVGAFLSENSSTSVAGEISTFEIGRALGCGGLFQPAVNMELRGTGLATFRRLLEAGVFVGAKELNRQQVLDEIASDPAVLHGVFKQWLPMKPVAYRSIELPDFPPNGALNESDPIARFLKRSAPQARTEMIDLPGVGGSAPACELARQLSDILLVDAMAGEWDRFSGANLHAYVESGRARLVALDNGGASFKNDQGYLDKFKSWVTRFDPEVAANLFELEKFCDRPGEHEFRGFRDEASLARALNIDGADAWDVFKQRVRKVAAHVREAEKAGGAFFPIPRERGTPQTKSVRRNLASGPHGSPPVSSL